jgi:hypothetical protein
MPASCPILIIPDGPPSASSSTISGSGWAGIPGCFHPGKRQAFSSAASRKRSKRCVRNDSGPDDGSGATTDTPDASVELSGSSADAAAARSTGSHPATSPTKPNDNNT